ncbi:alpha/beta fold hydrolase [Tenacibaculum singaporense]|uniref:Proline iminopeptidase n=1 Tax=Tenacibaculum singaporense TaxID=2358479 RepID=A0A3S8R694_9FLAO|nr:alpha/beta fold hydrolase [Tenacibaculum singaporense]AZJ35278.1 alpha/beta fold hydrolase [Tenacibaculum singaporense]
MKLQRTIILVIVFNILSFTIVNAQSVRKEERESPFPNSKFLEGENIQWGNLIVPENWEVLKGEVKIAYSVLQNKKRNNNSEAVVFIQGGPGASGTETIWQWVNHPIREDKDIILFDIRGTGLSEPRLCPDLGKKILEILSENQSEEEDEKEKINAVISCKTALISKGIDISSYNSLSVAKDMNALKASLGYKKWSVYGVSYGTHVAQVYASNYPNDVESLILDSPISSISSYYEKNTDGFMNSLLKVFKKCKDDPACNSRYNNIETMFFDVIRDLETNPITVKVDAKFLKSGKFTFNSEDFKVVIQQALYHKQMIEIVPLLISQFKERNKKALSNLVPSFASLLSMDYGVYYCFSCEEILPLNSISKFNKESYKYKGLDGGVAFYESDFKVCEKWGEIEKDSLFKVNNSTKNLKINIPTIIISGEYDPITPSTNGSELKAKLTESKFLEIPTYGHSASFTKKGTKLVSDFLSDKEIKSDAKLFSDIKPVYLVNDITINSGVFEMGNSFNNLDPVFLSPLVIALILMVFFIINYTIKIFKKEYSKRADSIIRFMGVFTSIIGILCFVLLLKGMNETAANNYFILAFGLPSSFDYVFTGITVFAFLLILSFAYYFLKLKSIRDRSIVFSLLFSNLLCIVYLMYWGII